MLKPKPNFDRVWSLLQQMDSLAGVFLFRDSSSKPKSKLEKLLSLILPAQAILSIFIFTSTLIVTKFALINIIICVSFAMPFLMCDATLVKFYTNKKTLKNLIDWCRSLYDVEKKFSLLVREIAETHLETIERRAFKIVRLLQITFYFNACLASIGFVIIGHFLPENIFPKFSVPLPFYLPFNDQRTWLAFITTVVTQTFFAIIVTTLGIFIFGVLFCIAIHILGFLDIILGVIQKMKREMQTNVEVEVQKDSKLQLSTLAIINASLNENSTKTSFPVWMSIVTDMISDVNSVLTPLCKLYSQMFLLIELTSLGTIFICGLIFIVLREQYFFAVGVSAGPSALFVMCYINEKILDKFDGIKKELYDISWYELKSKESKMLLIAMNCDEIQKGFTAAEIHKLTIERFGIILKTGYTNLLVLKDLVMK